MGPNIEQELRYQQPGTARLGIDADGALLVSAEDIIEVDVTAVNRLLVTASARSGTTVARSYQSRCIVPQTPCKL